jgi:predicted HAD superfamily phosphohydrolase
VRNRTEALKVLYEVGMEKRRMIFEKAEATKEQVDAMKEQLRGMAGNGTGAS